MSLAKTKSSFDSLEDDDSSHTPLMFPAHRNLALRKHRSVPQSTLCTQLCRRQYLLILRVLCVYCTAANLICGARQYRQDGAIAVVVIAILDSSRFVEASCQPTKCLVDIVATNTKERVACTADLELERTPMHLSSFQVSS